MLFPFIQIESLSRKVITDACFFIWRLMISDHCYPEQLLWPRCRSRSTLPPSGDLKDFSAKLRETNFQLELKTCGWFYLKYRYISPKYQNRTLIVHNILKYFTYVYWPLYIIFRSLSWFLLIQNLQHPVLSHRVSEKHSQYSFIKTNLMAQTCNWA